MTDGPEASGVVAGRGTGVVAGDLRGGAVGDVMGDLPLPEALIDAAVAAHRSARLADEPSPMRHALATVLAVRDESGHRVVWSAEEVAAIIEERDKALFAGGIASRGWAAAHSARETAEARIEALEREVEPLIEALTEVVALYENVSRYKKGDLGRALDGARAALARVRGTGRGSK